MSYEYSKAVYWNVHDTSPTEQSVLAALAFCHNRETGRCDPSASTISDMTHFGRASVNRALVSLKDKHYISWVSGGKGKKDEANSNKYTLYLAAATSRCDTHTVSEREGDCLTVIHSPSQSETQKRIESKSNPNLKKELAGLVGDAFADAARPRVPKVPSARAEAAGVGVFDEFWSAYPDCIYKTPSAKARCGSMYAQLRGDSSDGTAFDGMILAALKAWRESKQWEKDGGRYVPAPINFFARRLWEVNPTPNDPAAKLLAEKRNARLQRVMSDPAAWILCEERCAKFKDGKCSEGMTIPPDKSDWQIPPEECSLFARRTP